MCNCCLSLSERKIYLCEVGHSPEHAYLIYSKTKALAQIVARFLFFLFVFVLSYNDFIITSFGH